MSGQWKLQNSSFAGGECIAASGEKKCADATTFSENLPRIVYLWQYGTKMFVWNYEVTCVHLRVRPQRTQLLGTTVIDAWIFRPENLHFKRYAKTLYNSSVSLKYYNVCPYKILGVIYISLYQPSSNILTRALKQPILTRLYHLNAFITPECFSKLLLGRVFCFLRARYDIHIYYVLSLSEYCNFLCNAVLLFEKVYYFVVVLIL